MDTCYDGYDRTVDLIKLTAEQADHVLVRWIGLPLAETDALNMGSFAYLANYDAYYHFHGDTNALSDVCFYAGERSGDTVTLYYQPEQCGVQLMDTAGSGDESGPRSLWPPSRAAASRFYPTSFAPGRTLCCPPAS